MCADCGLEMPLFSWRFVVALAEWVNLCECAEASLLQQLMFNLREEMGYAEAPTGSPSLKLTSPS